MFACVKVGQVGAGTHGTDGRILAFSLEVSKLWGLQALGALVDAEVMGNL